MGKLAQLPEFEGVYDAGLGARRQLRLRTRYYAFLSYSHKDKELADWLHRELERFRVPSALAGRLTANGVVPRRLTPIFRDEQDLSAGGDLAVEIKAALAASQFLIVLCSPIAAKSRWTNQEIESFKRTRPEGCVLAAVVAGEPFASEMPGREDEECFPPALRFKYDRRGHQTAKRAEPLAADFRASGEGQRLAFLKLVAGMLGVGLDELVQREQTRRHRRMAWLAAASLAGMAVTSTLAIAAIEARDEARDQRRQAEGLISFMLGDLREKLEPIGKLDTLAGVGGKVLAYYRNQPISDLSDEALLQRSRALSLMADVATQRGNTDTALGLYREAMAGTAEAIRRKPDDPQRLFEHAQNVFYVGAIAYGRGQLDEAGSQFTEYKRLADRMVAIEPNNMKWRMEVQNALTNLGSVRLAQRRFAESAALSEEAVRTIEALTTADPNNREYQQSFAESLAWSADAERDAGHIGQSVALRERHVAYLNRLLSQTGDAAYRQRLVTAERKLGFLYAMRDQSDLAVQHMRAAVAQGDQLTAIEPNNRKWLEHSALAKYYLAYVLAITGKTGEASQQNDSSCALISRLIAKDPKLADWRVDYRECWIMRGYIDLAKGASANASNDAQQAIRIAGSFKSREPATDAFALARAYRLLGDARKAMGDGSGAAAAWNAAFRALPGVQAERPIEMQEHAIILQRLGRNGEAQELNQRLAAMGYRLREVKGA
ncbi:MAG: toll/interleukin-1 receptor domain-containing protein [Sphingomonas sp.]|nr:toll/interleukin-1 receptor domain-containing protein [Sphingomonas sp.]